MVDFTELADAAALRCAAENVRDPERSAEALRGLDRLEARVAELEAALEYLRMSGVSLASGGRVHKPVRDGNQPQSAEVFYSCLFAAVGAQVGQRENNQPA